MPVQYLRLLFVATCVMLFSAVTGFAIDINKDFFKKHLRTESYPIDTEAVAIVLYESIDINIGTQIASTRSISYVQTQTVHKIVKILKPDALEEANSKIFLPSDGAHYYITRFVATTYNLSGDELLETKLNKSDIYEKEISEHLLEYTFTFPGVKEGSIVEYSYELTSPVERFLPRWNIQGKYPKLYSQYSISFPEQYEFTTLTHVRDTARICLSVADAEKSTDNFCKVSTEIFGENKRHETFWLKRNVPAIRSEPYVNTPANYMENIEFKMTGYSTKRTAAHLENNWEKLNSDFLQNEQFGKAISAQNAFLSTVIDSITKKNNSVQAKIIAIYNYVRSNFKSSGWHGIYVKNSLKEVFDNREGTQGELNLLLTAMLLHAGIPAAPLILNTQGNLSPSPALPIKSRFNYVACAVQVDSNFILLDASDPGNVMGMLPAYCYNGYAWIIKKDGVGIYLNTNLLSEKAVISVKLNNFTDSTATIEILEKFGLIQSSGVRKSWAKNEHGRKSYMDELLRDMPTGFTILDSNVENEHNPDTNLVIKFSGKIRLRKNDQGSIYINAAVAKLYKTNPFKSATRTLPIEFQHQTRYRYNMTITLPADMEPADLPKEISLDLDSSSITYHKVYNFVNELHLLTVNSDFNLATTSFPPEYYTQIRDFYGEMINGNNEVITLKRKTK